MNRRRQPIGSYVVIILLCLLIAKLGLISVFLCTRKTALPLRVLESSEALAEDVQEGQTGDQSSDREMQALSDVPELTELQKRIASVREHLEGINVDLKRCFETFGPDRISPETLEHKRAQIETERLQLEEERKRLAELKQEIDTKLSKLTELQSRVERKLDERKIVRNERIKHLIKIYTAMPAKQAADLIENLEMEVIIAVFSEMKGDKVGPILRYVPAEKAAQISERLAQLD